jgi:hypothetical protein
MQGTYRCFSGVRYRTKGLKKKGVAASLESLRYATVDFVYSYQKNFHAFRLLNIISICHFLMITSPALSSLKTVRFK